MTRVEIQLLLTAGCIASGAIAVRHLVRTFFYPSPPVMPAPADVDVNAAIRRFEAALSAHAPEVLAALQPGLSDDELSGIESRHRLRLTDELRALYRWRNGSPRDAEAELIPGHWFVPLDYAAAQRNQMRRETPTAPLVQRIAFNLVAGHRVWWLNVFDDSCGDGYFYDPARRRRPGHFFYHFAEVRQYRFFPSLTNFLAGAAECYESGIYRARPDGTTREDFERASELWARYAS